MSATEVNFDGLIGPTHHYGGLSPGNLASQQHRHHISSPRKAALQGLAKMKRVADLGLVQGFFPPQRRPDFHYLRSQGFSGDPEEILSKAYQQRPDLLSHAYSASAMWTANAATVSPSADCQDGKVHLTPANLQAMQHRRLEVEQRTTLLSQIFHDPKHFVVHDPLPAAMTTSDEGAANHTRLCEAYGESGIELFVYGRDADSGNFDSKVIARQAMQASYQVAEQHRLDLSHCIFAQQNPIAINAGVFHNDVIAVGNQDLHLLHASAYLEQDRILHELEMAVGPYLKTIVVEEQELSLEEAVKTYFFNSQLITVTAGSMLLLCPIECEESDRAKRLIDSILTGDNPIDRCEFVDLRESMQNGGGPACLRLRVVLTEEELASIPNNYLLTDQRYKELYDWVSRHYREQLAIEDLADPALMYEVDAALDELEAMLNL